MTSNISREGLLLINILGMAPTVMKIGVLLLSMYYLFFAFLLTRRVKIMNTNFKTPFSGMFTLIVFLNLVASLAVTAITLLTLIK
jgi:hypothetical protein